MCLIFCIARNTITPLAVVAGTLETLLQNTDCLPEVLSLWLIRPHAGHRAEPAESESLTQGTPEQSGGSMTFGFEPWFTG